MRIILHIGANKTGTSAIQAYFHKNRDALLRQGILWPRTGLMGHAHYRLSDVLGFGRRPGLYVSEEEFADTRRAFFTEIKKTAPTTVILSSEMFIRRRDMSRLTTFFEGCNLEIVVFLRRHDTWLPSLWSQAIKTVNNPPWGRTFESFLEFQFKQKGQFYDFRELVDAWEAEFPGNFRAWGDRCLFTAETPAFGGEPWISDGKAEGTYMIKDIAPGPNHAFAGGYTPLEKYALFRASDGTSAAAKIRPVSEGRVMLIRREKSEDGKVRRSRAVAAATALA